MPVRIVIGLLVTVVGFGIAARRFHWLSKLIRSGKKDPNRSRGPSSRKVEAKTVEVAGQRKLLQWTVPGLAHFFTMWGFTILLLTIIEAYGDLFNKYFHIPIIGTWNWVGFIEDFFACAVLVALVTFTIIRLKNAPSRLERKSRFFGSHTRCRLDHPPHDRRRHHHAAPLPGAQVNTDPTQFPYGWGAFASHARGQAAGPARRRHQRRAGHGVPPPQHRHHLGLHRLRQLLEAPAHLLRPHQRRLLAAPRPWAASTARPTWTWRTSTRTPSSASARSASSPGADARLRHLHRVRALPVGLPGLEHRQAALTQAPHHGPARQHVRLGHPAAHRRGRADRAGANVIDPDVLWSCTTCGRASTSARSTSSTSTPSSTCAATRS